jgi:hypothetical protein
MVGVADGAEPSVSFRRHRLDDKFRSEGVAVGDLNQDGRPDIAAGFVWYEAPEWTMRVVASEPPSPSNVLLGSPPHYDPKGYSNSFCCYVEDLNRDGWADLIVVDFPGTPTWWFENPRGQDRAWTRHQCTGVTNNESPDFLDLDGDGRRELVAAVSPDARQPDGPQRQMAIIRPVEDPLGVWRIQAISTPAAPGTRRYSHGLGVGDLNRDGRWDVLCADGWWEAPDSSLSDASPWAFHSAQFGERSGSGEGKAAQLCVYDFDGDGDQDVLATSPHAFGIWWHEQADGGKWVAHEIDGTFSQTHAVCLADINSDGLMDFVTGKRWWAHAQGDPGGEQPAVLFWFELQRQQGRPVWTPHLLDQDSGVGTQFTVADVNADRLLDVVVSSKKGVHWFEQVRE